MSVEFFVTDSPKSIKMGRKMFIFLTGLSIKSWTQLVLYLKLHKTQLS
jgi:hypothetical protein